MTEPESKEIKNFSDLPDFVKKLIIKAASENLKANDESYNSQDFRNDKEIKAVYEKLVGMIEQSDYPMILTSFESMNVLNMNNELMVSTLLQVLIECIDKHSDKKEHDETAFKIVEVLSHHIPGELGKDIVTLNNHSHYVNGEYVLEA